MRRRRAQRAKEFQEVKRRRKLADVTRPSQLPDGRTPSASQRSYHVKCETQSVPTGKGVLKVL
jgi:hypothetical protein